ncbi:hypothetical protein JDV02_008387 [Purpureocillium takamizusanense]|uniref:Rhodopsin domain-containing protein n=1 Tax=Purpureocillium takamizusanense TaxID=2060973 RepID=A0A9Q8QPI3_9HYPO|nr:uncharacterized protein JDV02_008387 [Purpureocillium takamizusanense]UNI22501.1 hypothetical protein JDV02_008387 [Purpureocillium takamizusanense]
MFSSSLINPPTLSVLPGQGSSNMSWSTEVAQMSDAELEAAVREEIEKNNVAPWFTAEHLRENYDRPAIAIIATLTVLVVTVVVCRLLSRRYIIKRFGVGVDDGLALASLAVYLLFVGLCIYIISLGAGRHLDQWDMFMDDNTFERIQIFDAVAHLTYTTSLWLCRTSGLAFYYRMCNLHRELLICVKVILGMVTLGFLAQVAIIVFHCKPVTLLWVAATEEEDLKLQCVDWATTNLAISGVALLCDLLLFGLPAAMLWILKTTRRKKVQLACILLPGIIVIGISATRIPLIMWYAYDEGERGSYALLKLLCVEAAEISATLIALSVPGIKPMFDKYILRKDMSSMSAHSGRDTPLESRGEMGSKDRPPIHFEDMELPGPYMGK